MGAVPDRLGAVPHRVLLVGFGLANQAVAAALLARGHRVAVTDDRPGDAQADDQGPTGQSMAPGIER